MRTGLRVATGLIGGLVLLATAVWGYGALWFQGPDALSPRLALLVGWTACVLAGLGALARRRWPPGLVYGLALVGLLGWWSTLTPSNDRDWAPDVARLATGRIEGDRLVMRNVRDFDWRTADEATERWEDRTYDLRRLEGVDVFFATWGVPGIAHVIVSFTFTDAPPLAFSIEIRRERGEAYSALAGFFRQYELIIVAADERDVIGVRSNRRGEDVRLYRLRIGPSHARQLIGYYVASLNALAETPEFYNTLLDNCTTLAFGYAREIWPTLRPDWRVVLSGFGPEYAYAIGAVDTSLPFAELAERGRIAERARAADGAPDFSARIREGVPRPRADGPPAG
ncbi:Lnb N-terminal periplasmic domain-containing protein [Marinivivus vitaminiproducens]|uniref:Lnb N-terminal periplasmic domain-containing protein n=1 Tax=Marinivivus vitaminiproducens TaxID=3035935 RepID=UPI0027A6A821|nr:DUF4105 domain-containing protein [Geminicoccaceae bacterium SCSIO 64248]